MANHWITSLLTRSMYICGNEHRIRQGIFVTLICARETSVARCPRPSARRSFLSFTSRHTSRKIVTRPSSITTAWSQGGYLAGWRGRDGGMWRRYRFEILRRCVGFRVSGVRCLHKNRQRRMYIGMVGNKPWKYDRSPCNREDIFGVISYLHPSNRRR